MGGLRSSRSCSQYGLLESSSRPSSPLNNFPSGPAPSSTPAPAYDSTSVFSTERIEYRTLEVTCAVFANLVLSTPPQPNSTYIDGPTPVFYVKNNVFPQYGPSVTLTDKTRHGKPLGYAQLRWGRSDLFGLGPCSSLMTWQKLRRVSPATHSRFEFEFKFGSTGGGTRKFIWRRKFPNILNDQPDLALHEIVGWGIRGAWGRESPEVLASYTGMRFGRWKRNGKLQIKHGVAGGSGVRFQDRGDKEDEIWGEWETIVTLTAMAIVEAARRRSIRKTPDPKLSEARP